MKPAGNVFRQIAARLGIPGWMALALLAFAAWGEGVDAPGIEQDTAALRAQTLRYTGRSAPSATSFQPALATLEAKLASGDGASQALAGLLKGARAAGLTVSTVEYRTQASGLPGVSQHAVSLPVTGSYAALRGWLAEALRTQPSLSLDALSMHRDDPNSGSVEARVTLSLWVRESTPGSLPSSAGVAR